MTKEEIHELPEKQINTPKSFKLFSKIYTVRYDNARMQDLELYGMHDYASSSIILASGANGIPFSTDTILDSFYHEKVHAILSAMNEEDLNKNEKFIDVFAKLLRQSDETTKY